MTSIKREREEEKHTNRKVRGMQIHISCVLAKDE